ncbi:hypothetical protein E3E14_13365 [Streptomyces sp. ICN441]|nr:hypothetical protein E3E14_13365 [Streptomyces sp. ICN441]
MVGVRDGEYLCQGPLAEVGHVPPVIGEVSVPAVLGDPVDHFSTFRVGNTTSVPVPVPVPVASRSGSPRCTSERRVAFVERRETGDLSRLLVDPAA